MATHTSSTSTPQQDADLPSSTRLPSAHSAILPSTGGLAHVLASLQLRHRLGTLATIVTLRRRGCRPGPHFFVHGHRPRLLIKGSLIIGDHVNMRCDAAPVWIEVRRGATLILSDRTLLNTGATMICHNTITIGPSSRIGPDCVLCDTNFHPVHEGDLPHVAPIRLGRNVWLGRGVIVLPGVTIGDNAVVAAGSVVFSDIPACEVWRGNPAVHLKDVRCSPTFVRP